MADTSTTPPTSVTGPRRTSGRSILAALFWLLSCLAILVGSVTLWAHQTLLTPSGWGGLVANMASDEEVVAATSEKLVARVSDALGIEERIAAALPGEESALVSAVGGALDMLGLRESQGESETTSESGSLLASTITTALEDRVTVRVEELASSEEFQDAFVAINELAHEAAMAIIRGEGGEALTTEEGTITLNVFPLIEGVLVAFQDAGYIDESVEIPDLSSYEPDPDNVALLERALDRDIPDDIGTITLVESERLDEVQSAVRNFDIITVALIVIAIVCVGLAIWLSARRLRMVLWLAVGSIVALLLGRGFTRLIIEDITGALQQGEGGPAVRAIVEGAVDSLLWFTFALIVVALVVAGVAILVERRAELAEVTAEPASTREWLRSRSRAIGYVGIGLIAFFVLWNVGGPDITLLATALLGIVLIVVALLGRRGGEDERAEAGEGSDGGEAAAA